MYDFDKQINRLDSDSIKWNALEQIYGTSDLLPMWVADMDFLSPSQITQALIHRAEHGIFGYGFLPEHTNHVIKNWVKKRYHWEIDEEWLVPSAGVVNAIAMAIQSLTNVETGS